MKEKPKPPSLKARCDNTLALFGEILQQLRPPPPITIDEWCDQNRFLSSDVTSEPGPWRTAFTPYLREVMRAISDHKTERVVLMSAARAGKTVSSILNPIAYQIANDPGPIMVVFPTVELGERFSKKELAAMIRDTPALRGKVAEARSRDGMNTLSLKMFNGGSIQISGANSGNSLRAVTIKYLYFDEVDGAPESAGTEGDPVRLAERRTTTYSGRGRKIILVSTPTVKGHSRIEVAYENSTQEQWNLPCPSCGEMQPLLWGQVNFETVEHACRECGALHPKHEWLAGEGQWIARNPDSPVRGFHVNALVSPFVSWADLVEEWRQATALANVGQFEQLQVFKNTVLGEVWEEVGLKVSEEGLMARREVYYADVPDGVCAITIAADTQDNRLAVDVIGWGAGKESWRLGYSEPWGDPRVPGSPVWAQLDEIIQKPYTYANGVRVPVVCTTIDMGGHAPDQVCTYAKARQGWNVWAVRGVGGFGKMLIHSTVGSKVASATVFNLGVDTGKDDVMARLRVKDPGPGYCHFPRGDAVDHTGAYESVRGYDASYFAALTAEKKISVRVKGGHHSYQWQKQSGQRNEAFDTAVYNLAALTISKVNLDRIAAKAPWAQAPQIAASSPTQPKPRARKPRAPLNQSAGINAYTAV